MLINIVAYLLLIFAVPVAADSKVNICKMNDSFIFPDKEYAVFAKDRDAFMSKIHNLDAEDPEIIDKLSIYDSDMFVVQDLSSRKMLAMVICCDGCGDYYLFYKDIVPKELFKQFNVNTHIKYAVPAASQTFVTKKGITLGDSSERVVSLSRLIKLGR